jgi:hypothetical protein
LVAQGCCKVLRDSITAFALFVVEELRAQETACEVLDSTAVTRDAKRRGLGWLVGQADIGWSNRIGWYEEVHLWLSGIVEEHVGADLGPQRRARNPSCRAPAITEQLAGLHYLHSSVI